MLRIVPPTVPRVGRSYEHFPDVFELHLLQEDFKEMLEDKAFQRPCALVFCRDSGTGLPRS